MLQFSIMMTVFFRRIIAGFIVLSLVTGLSLQHPGGVAGAMDMTNVSPTTMQMQAATDCGHCIDDNTLFPSCMTWFCGSGQFFAPLADGFRLSLGSEPVEVPVQTFLLGIAPTPEYRPPKQTSLHA